MTPRSKHQPFSRMVWVGRLHLAIIQGVSLGRSSIVAGPYLFSRVFLLACFLLLLSPWCSSEVRKLHHVPGPQAPIKLVGYTHVCDKNNIFSIRNIVSVFNPLFVCFITFFSIRNIVSCLQYTVCVLIFCTCIT